MSDIPAGRVAPDSELGQLIHQTQIYAAERRRSIQEEYGLDDYNVLGMVVVGSVAANTARPDSDLDVYPVTRRGDADVTDLVQFLGQASGRRVDRMRDYVAVEAGDSVDIVDTAAGMQELLDLGILTEDDIPDRGYLMDAHFIPLGHPVDEEPPFPDLDISLLTPPSPPSNP